MISSWCFCSLWILVAAFSIFQVVVTSCRAFGDFPRIRFLRSSFPSANCSCTLAISSSSVLMLLVTRNSDISTLCNLFLVSINYLSTSFDVFEMIVYKALCRFSSWVSQFSASRITLQSFLQTYLFVVWLVS